MGEIPTPEPTPARVSTQENPFSNPIRPDDYIQSKETGNLREAVTNAGSWIIGNSFRVGSEDQQQFWQRHLAGLLPEVTKDLKEHPELLPSFLDGMAKSYERIKERTNAIT